MDEECIPEKERQRARLVGYVLTILATFSLGVTEIFAPWYAGKLGASDFEIGLAMGSFGIVYMFSPILGGRISDRIGRKKSLLVATASYLSIIVLYPQPFIIPLHIILIRSLEGLFFGLFYPTVEALIAELCPESQGAVLGNFSVSWSLGMTMSPGAIAFMVLMVGNVSIIYVVMAVELVALGMIAGFVGQYSTVQGHQMAMNELIERYPTDNPIKPVREGVHTSARFVASYVSIALFGFTSTTLLAFFTTYIETMTPYGPEVFGSLLMVWNVTRTIAFFVSSRLSHQGMGRLMIVGSFLVTLGMLTIFITIDIIMLTTAMVLTGFGVGFAYLGALYSVISATDNEKGRYAGFIESLAGVGFFVGPIAAGYAAGFFATGPYILTTVYALISFVLVLLLLRKDEE